MTTVFHARLYGRFIEIQSNFKRKKLHERNQDPHFLRDSYSNKKNVRSPIQIKRESQPQHHKSLFFLKNTPIHFHVNCKTDKIELSFSSIEINKPLPTQSTVSCRSDSNSEANSSYCHKSDAWSHLEFRVVSSAQIPALQITLSGKSLCIV